MQGVSALPRDAVKESDRAYEALRTLIVRTELSPGAVLDEGGLQSQLQIGRTPLREALQRLTLDHLVVIHPRRGTFVADISIDDLSRICEVRLPLEGHCARLAAERLTDNELGSLVTLLRHAESVARGSDYYAIGEVDRRLHLAVAAGAHNGYLTEVLGRLLALHQRIVYFTHNRTPTKDVLMYVEWNAIVDALTQHDAEAAEQAMRRHIAHSKTAVLGTF